jgi:FkbH-like protein
MSRELKEVSILIKSKSTQLARSKLRDAYNRGLIACEEMNKASRLLKKTESKSPQLNVLLLGQFTTTWLKSIIPLIALGDGFSINVDDGEFDNVYQDILKIFASNSKFPDVIVLLPWADKVLKSRNFEDVISQEIKYWRMCRNEILKYKSCKIIQSGYDWMSTGAMGFHSPESGHIKKIQEINIQLQRSLETGVYFLPLMEISGWIGKRNFYSQRQYHWAKQPFSEQGLEFLSKNIWASIRALNTGSKKVLVTDLDNTLWGGVVGEEGPLGINLGEDVEGESFIAYQRYLKQLSLRGIIIAVASKNNREDALEPFIKNPQMVLQLEDISCFVASWEPKTAMLQQISSQLRLGADSFVFVDDNPAEREQIRQKMPEVTVVEIPLDPAEYVRNIEEGLWFESLPLTKEDKKRSELYKISGQANDSKHSFDCLNDYLISLQMSASIELIDDLNIQRIIQLLGRTNQFNLTTRRHSKEKVKDILENPHNIGMAMNFFDRFGEYGLISVIIGIEHPDEKNAIILDSWLMSCRVIGRTAESFFFNEFIKLAENLNYKKVFAKHIPTAKNQMLNDLLPNCGFREGRNEDYLELNIIEKTPNKTFVKNT